MNPTDEPATPSGFYTPGYARMKTLMIFLGFILVALGLWQLRTPLRLLLFGESARAEATSVIKTKPGLPDVNLRDDAQVQSRLEPRDRSYVFWNEFSFATPDGRMFTVRATVGSQLKPLYPLLDADGLPTADRVWYDASNPNIVIFPLSVSTWFAPGMLVFIGILTVIIGSVLRRWATQPIALPHLPPPAKQEV